MIRSEFADYDIYRDKQDLLSAYIYLSRDIGLLFLSLGSLIGGLIDKDLPVLVRKVMVIFSGMVIFALFQVVPYY
jgi:hypothetical protein